MTHYNQACAPRWLIDSLAFAGFNIIFHLYSFYWVTSVLFSLSRPTNKDCDEEPMRLVIIPTKQGLVIAVEHDHVLNRLL